MLRDIQKGGKYLERGCRMIRCKLPTETSGAPPPIKLNKTQVLRKN